VRSGIEFRTIEGVRPGVTASRWCLGIELLGLIIGLVDGEALVRVPSGRKAPCSLGVVLAMLPEVKNASVCGSVWYSMQAQVCGWQRIQINLVCDAVGATHSEHVGVDRADEAVAGSQKRRRKARMAAIAMITEGQLACCYRNTHRGARLTTAVDRVGARRRQARRRAQADMTEGQAARRAVDGSECRAPGCWHSVGPAQSGVWWSWWSWSWVVWMMRGAWCAVR
jgi:hypothetical protein